jgi:hypothetical protein
MQESILIDINISVTQRRSRVAKNIIPLAITGRLRIDVLIF